MPQLISIPIPVANYKTLKAGENFWPDLNANFFAPNQFLPCGVTFTAPEIIVAPLQLKNRKCAASW